jgi:hypothetical protein
MLIVYIVNYFQKCRRFVRELIQSMADELILLMIYVHNLVHKSTEK